VIEEGGAAIVERWCRGAVCAVLHRIDEEELILDLRWPGSTRGGRVAAESSAEAREVAELLARDTRARRGVDAEAGAAFSELVTATLPDLIEAVEPVRRLLVTRLDVSLAGGESERFDAIEPRDRAALIAGALASAPG
jgi:MoxR-like ATPase